MSFYKVIITKSDKKDKKYMATFISDTKIKKVHFGASGYEDYTIHKDDERKERYLLRHKKNEDFNNPLTPGALSRWILWNKKSFRESIADYKKRFNFK